MPELPEVEAVRLELEPAMRGARFVAVWLRRPDLRRPFPRDFAARLHGRTVTALQRRGKYLVGVLDSGDTLVMHLGMSGSFRVDRLTAAGEPDVVERHDHVVFDLSSGHRVTFNDPRRFGVMDLVAAAGGSADPGLEAMGPEPLSAEFDAKRLAAACAGKRTSLKVTLLDQRVVAGLGNIYVSEALNLSRLSPRRQASTIATATGLPREGARRLAAAIKTVLRRAVALQQKANYRQGRFRVYERHGEPCPNRGCRGTIRRIVQAGRSTYYCPTCQK